MSSQQPARGEVGRWVRLGDDNSAVSADEDNNDSQTPDQSPSNTEHTVWASFRPWAPPSFEPYKQSNAGSVKNQFLKSHSGLNFIPFHPSLRQCTDSMKMLQKTTKNKM